MFGRLRPPPSPPEYLERCPAKIIKDDPLSVYESTLLKLKQGSRLDNIGPCPEPETENLPSIPDSFQAPDVCSDTQRDSHDATLSRSSDAMAIDSGSGQCEQKNKNPSVLTMFSRYKNLAQARSSSHTVDRD